jgi:hypothetical protein
MMFRVIVSLPSRGGCAYNSYDRGRSREFVAALSYRAAP